MVSAHGNYPFRTSPHLRQCNSSHRSATRAIDRLLGLSELHSATALASSRKSCRISRGISLEDITVLKKTQTDSFLSFKDLVRSNTALLIVAKGPWRRSGPSAQVSGLVISQTRNDQPEVSVGCLRHHSRIVFVNLERPNGIV